MTRNRHLGKFVNSTLESLNYQIIDDGTRLPESIAWKSAIENQTIHNINLFRRDELYKMNKDMKTL